jgi:uncharacterized protein (DUF302 family)
VIQSLAFEVVLDSAHDAAVDIVTEALQAEGFGILTRIDLHEAFKEKLDIEFRPYTILGACNPPLAHRALSRRPEIGLLLPCNVTVESNAEDGSTAGGGTTVRISDPHVLMTTTGGFDADRTILGVAAEAHERLSRVADALADR